MGTCTHARARDSLAAEEPAGTICETAVGYGLGGTLSSATHFLLYKVMDAMVLAGLIRAQVRRSCSVWL